jgi:hypothetical protein
MPQMGTLIQKSHRWIPSTISIQSGSRTVTYPRNVLSKAATNDWTYAGTNSDGHADDPKPLATMTERNQIRHDDFCHRCEPSCSNTLHRPARKKYGEAICHGGGDSPSCEENKRKHDHWLPAEDFGEAGVAGLKNRRGESEGCSRPEGLDC